ncbi:MAG: CoA transferase [Rhodospirillales bacterium]|nr:CoA transferase [Rhodospirillales bacterium]
MIGALDGIRVLDLSRILAGPMCTQLMGDYGAEIIKVERPGVGDDTRKWGPHCINDENGDPTTESAFYLSANRNKRSVAIDIAAPAGQALIRRLLPKCDVLIENFKAGALARYGLGYDDLKDEFPGLVYCSITGFGQTGPYASRAGYDYLAQGMGGIMSVTGEPDGAPIKVGVGIADIMTGMHSAVAVLAALRHRDATGQGQHIDLALLDTQVSWLAYHAVEYLNTGTNPDRLGNAHASVVPYGVFPTADGHVILAAGNDAQFRQFCESADRPELAQDPRFTTNLLRIENRDALKLILDEIFTARTTDDWITLLEVAGVPCGPINTLDRVFADPQVEARSMAIEMEHPLAGSGKVALAANPAKLTGTPLTYRRPPPTLGQHTEEVLAEMLDLTGDELAALRKTGAIV